MVKESGGRKWWKGRMKSCGQKGCGQKGCGENLNFKSEINRIEN